VFLCIFILGIFILGCIEKHTSFFLRVESLDTKEVLLNLPIKPGDQFYLDYIHSSAKTPVLDTFHVGSNGEMLLVEEDYQWYGAGLEFMDYKGVRVVLKGKETKTILKRHFPFLLLRVGWVANQKLIFNDKIIPLNEVAEGGELLKIWIARAGE